jgi:hypothetical protein
MPGMIAGIVGTITAAVATEEEYMVTGNVF